MAFSSLQFVFLFLPGFFGCYYLVPGRRKNFVLLIGSLCFYFIGTLQNPAYFILLIMTVLADFKMGRILESKRRSKWFLTMGIGLHLLCLAVFKYGGFIAGEIRRLFPVFDYELEWLMPLGISFYTFQGISYIVDVYKGKTAAEKSLLRFSVYMLMFPKLLSGPLVTYGQIKNELARRRITVDVVFEGMGTFIFGLGLKVLLANPVGKLWSQVQAIGFESISTPLAWMAILAFSLQIYFDFFGYSLMASGLGRMLGFHIPDNFQHPYLSRSMTEFWRRWHITLGAWFKEYVYIPLGGNRRGRIREIRNLLIVWLLTGIWHGAGCHFLLWGALLFFLIAVEKLILSRYLSKAAFIGHVYVILLIPLTWAVFAIGDMEQLRVFFSRLFPFFGQGEGVLFRLDYLKYGKLYGPFLLAGILFSTRLPFRFLKRLNSRIWIGLLLAIICAASAYCMYRGSDGSFLYFRF